MAHRKNRSGESKNGSSNEFLNSTMSELMSESVSKLMSELERARMQMILSYLDVNKEINSSTAAKLLEVEIKTAKLDVLKSVGKTKNKVYFKK